MCEVREGVISSRLSVNWGVVLQLALPFFGLACSFDIAPNNAFQMGIQHL